MNIFKVATLPRTKTLSVIAWSGIHALIGATIEFGVVGILAVFGPGIAVSTALFFGALACLGFALAMEIRSIATGSRDARADLPERALAAVVTLFVLDFWFGAAATLATAGYWLYARSQHPDADKTGKGNQGVLV